MSAYTIDYLQNHTRIGDVAKNGLPWTARGGDSPDSKNSDGDQWLWSGKIPLKAIREFFGRYTVESRPVFTVREARPGDTGMTTFTDENGVLFVLIPDESRQAISDIANDGIHGIFKSGYVIHDFLETLVERTARIVGDSPGSIHIDSAGVLADGGEGWVSLATDGLMSLPEGVDYYPHVLASSSHTGTLATSLQAVITMTVCDNTRACALGEGKRNGTVTKARHSSKSAQRLTDDESEAREALGLMEIANDMFAASVKSLCKQKVSDKKFDAFLDALAPITDDMSKNALTRAENFRDGVSLIYRKDERSAQWAGTAFGALQAVNTFDLWERTRHAGNDHYAANMRDTITGKAQTRESERHDLLVSVLANA